MKRLVLTLIALTIGAFATAQEKDGGMDITLAIGETEFSARLEDNDAARNVSALFPLTLSMSEYAGNCEYYVRLQQKIGTGNAARPQSFAAGDIALYNGLSLVIFYADTAQTAGYVKLGHIFGTGLKESLGRAKGNVTLSSTRLKKSDGKMTVTSESENIRALYEEMYRAMIAKDIATMTKIHGDEFVLVHMTGQRMDKGAYLAAVQDGTLNYYAAAHDDISVSVDGDHASLTGKTRVEAAVYGGSRRTWRLQQDMTLRKQGGAWVFTHSTASTY